MDEKKKERYIESLKRAVADFISHTSNRGSLITVTDVTLSKKEKRVYINISVYPESEEERALAFLKRNISEAREYIGKHVRIGFLPTINFQIDEGEKARRAFDEVLAKQKGGASETDAV
jgi:ribosome-binding factor A